MLQCLYRELLTGKRERAILALPLGCPTDCGALKPLSLRLNISSAGTITGPSLTIRQDRPHSIRAVPNWVKAAVYHWTTEAKIESGYLFRCVTKY